MKKHSEGLETGMLVVKSSDYELINQTLESLKAKTEVIALFNSNRQTVISGLKPQL